MSGNVLVRFQEMGFSWQQSEQAIRQHNNVQQAVDSMLSGMGTLSLTTCILEMSNIAQMISDQ